MSNQLAPASNGVLEALVLNGDLSKMSDQQKVMYYKHVCESLGINMMTQPFKILNLKGKLIMYATKDCSDQLRKRDGVSVEKLEAVLLGDIYIVTATAKNRDGKMDSDIGAVSIVGLKGEDLANAYMKATTKAKRRVTLSICGLGLPDESEVETIDANATIMDFPEVPKRKVSDKAFATALDRIKGGDASVIGKLREECELSDAQSTALLSFEDTNVPA